MVDDESILDSSLRLDPALFDKMELCLGQIMHTYMHILGYPTKMASTFLVGRRQRNLSTKAVGICIQETLPL
jgi:hypothetical protein